MKNDSILEFLLNEGGMDMTINCFKTVSTKGLIYLPVALRRFVGIHEDDGVPERSPAAKPFLRSKILTGTGKKSGGEAVFA